MTARRIALRIEYDGTGLCGWQRQDNGPTVQEHLESALSELLGTPTQVVGASRTDAGVHALGQVCHLEIDHPIPTDALAKGTNSFLPPQIAVLEAREVDADFHARFSARGKHYRYAILRRPIRSPMLANRAWHVRAELDIEAMRRAATAMIGERDFRAFQASGCTAKTTIREIKAIDIVADGDRIEIHVRGNAFLRNMVRILAGTLTEVGRGRITPSDVSEILDSGDRTRAGQTAPAAGLTLVRVFYDSFM